MGDLPPWFYVLSGVLIPVAMLALRLLTRERVQLSDPDGVAVFTGSRGACDEAVGHLADAGVACWLERHGDEWEVHVEAARAPEVPELLARRNEDPENQPVPRLRAVEQAETPPL